MPTKIDVVHLTATGHVVGVLARRGPAGGDATASEKLAALVGDAFPLAVTPGTAEFVLRPEWLSATELALDSSVSDVLLAPLGWAVGTSGALVRLAGEAPLTWSSPSFTLTFPAASAPPAGTKIVFVVATSVGTSLVEHTAVAGQLTYLAVPGSLPAVGLALVGDGASGVKVAHAT